VPQPSALSLPREHAAADGILAEDNEIFADHRGGTDFETFLAIEQCRDAVLGRSGARSCAGTAWSSPATLGARRPRAAIALGDAMAGCTVRVNASAAMLQILD
jgi:hypothetical protein